MDFKEALNTLPRVQRKVMAVLAQGGKYSVSDICIKTGASDPRGHISAMRRKGFDIQDEWRTSGDDVRYKVYWFNPNGII